jgi:hypothetical protein
MKQLTQTATYATLAWETAVSWLTRTTGVWQCQSMPVGGRLDQLLDLRERW